MNVLDPPYEGRDAGGMTARIVRAAEQIDEALAHAAAHPWALPAGTRPALLAVGAMGGSAIASDLSSALYADRMPRPVITVRDDTWPASVTPQALALICSYSGNTGESLALYRAAATRGVPLAALTTGGTLAEWAAHDGVPCMRMPGGSPPRAALYGAWVRFTLLLRALDWIDDPAAAWREAAEVQRLLGERVGPAVPEEANPAKRLARALHGRWPLVYSATRRLAPVGVRWRQQLNENAKVLAHSAVVPELNHNEIVGWERGTRLHAQVSVVVLRDGAESVEDDARLTLTAQYAASRGAAVHEVPATGEGALARMVSLVTFGDYVSLYLAFLEGADPTPIPSIDQFKQRLAELSARRDP